ncbi:MAG: hypothetical protein AAGA37_13675 [Actinomycetota bacterium]
MAGLILPAATAALTYKRLTDVVDRLSRKLNAATYSPEVSDLYRPTTRNVPERRVLALAQSAKSMFEQGATAPLADTGALPAGFSKFVVLGAGAWEWPDAAGLFAPAKPWVGDAMRTGNADPNAGHVHVDVNHFAFEAAKEAIARATTADEENQARAYAMGLLSATAYSTISAPILRGAHQEVSNRLWDRGLPGRTVARAEQRVLADLFGGAANINSWAPNPGDVSAGVHDGYLAALETVYGFPSTRPPGFAEYELAFVDGDEITAQRLRSAQSYLYQQTLTRTWGAGTWWLVLTPGLLAVPLSLLLGKALPTAQGYFSPGPHPGERGAYEILTLGMTTGAVAPFAWTMYLWSQLDDHQGSFVNSLVLGILRAGLSIGSLATHSASLPVPARWGGLYAPFQAIDLYALVRAIIHQAEGRDADAFVYWLNLLPTMSGATTLLFAELMKLIGLDTDVGYWITWVLLLLAMLTALGIPLAVWLANNDGIARVLEGRATTPALNTLTAFDDHNPRGPAELFDESTLRRDGPAPGFEDLRYPASTRGLVKIWWPADTTLEVAHDDHTVQLRVDGGPPTVITLGLNDLSAQGLADRLTAAVAGLEVAVIDADAADHPLLFPRALDDPGDEATSIERHDELADGFQPVGSSEDDGYVIRHTPHANQTTTYGLSGRSGSGVDAYPVVPQSALGDFDDSALGLAADLATLMTMGAAPTLAAAPIFPADAPGLPPITAPGQENNEVYQIFRRWNLDQRRINEWRMLIAGGAASEKTTGAADYDPGMRAHPAPAAYASPAPDGEALANQLGWIPTWRAWLKMASDLSADSAGTGSEPYNPLVPAPTGDLHQPSNADLTEAVRFLLDLP